MWPVTWDSRVCSRLSRRARSTCSSRPITVDSRYIADSGHATPCLERLATRTGRVSALHNRHTWTAHSHSPTPSNVYTPPSSTTLCCIASLAPRTKDSSSLSARRRLAQPRTQRPRRHQSHVCSISYHLALQQFYSDNKINWNAVLWCKTMDEQ